MAKSYLQRPTEERFNKSKLLLNVGKLPAWKQMAFMLSCCERMYPNYVAFARDTGWGRPEALRTALDKAWDALEEGKVACDFAAVIQECERVTPDTEKFTSPYTSAALDAAVAATLLLEVFSKFDQGRVVEAAELAADTVYMFVEGLEIGIPAGPAREERILRHPLMETELRLQREALELLESLGNRHQVVMHELRHRWANQRLGSIEMGSK